MMYMKIYDDTVYNLGTHLVANNRKTLLTVALTKRGLFFLHNKRPEGAVAAIFSIAAQR